MEPDTKPGHITIPSAMVERVDKFIEAFGEAEGLTTKVSVVRRALNEFLKKYEL